MPSTLPTKPLQKWNNKGNLDQALNTGDYAKELFLIALSDNGGFVGPALDKAGATWGQFKMWKSRDTEFREAIAVMRQAMFEKSLDLVQAGINGELDIDVRDQLALAMQFLRLSKDLSRAEAKEDARALIGGVQEINITIVRR